MPQYGIASIDLSQKWFDLVQGGKVVATTNVKDPHAVVRYGIRTVDMDSSSTSPEDKDGTSIACMEFVEEISTDRKEQPSSSHPLVQQINATLSRMQSSISFSSSSTQQPQPSQYAVQYKRVGNFAAQLQLVRTLRPPPSAGFAAARGGRTSCHPPPYDAQTDSFVVGPLRLQSRPLVATISTNELHDLMTGWDIYHNVSPADSRGHYLLIPTLSEPDTNWRGQVLTKDDCMDLSVLASNIHPAGSALICYNSVGAGASQNHIHCHLWPSPPIPLLEDDNIHGWDCYPASKAEAERSMTLYTGQQEDDDDEKKVQVSLLDYPCCCIKLSSASTNHLGTVLGTVVDTVQRMFDAPHNACLLNRPDGGVDAYVFVRSRERSPRIVPGSRSGASEMMGVFHTSSEEQLNELSSDEQWVSGDGKVEGAMETVLRHVSLSYETVWCQITAQLC